MSDIRSHNYPKPRLHSQKRSPRNGVIAKLSNVWGSAQMVRLEGFEPPTLGSVDRCSNPLSYSRSVTDVQS